MVFGCLSLCQMLPLYELMTSRDFTDGPTLKRNLRRALAEYLAEASSCRCAPCQNNGVAVLKGNLPIGPHEFNYPRMNTSGYYFGCWFLSDHNLKYMQECTIFSIYVIDLWLYHNVVVHLLKTVKQTKYIYVFFYKNWKLKLQFFVSSRHTMWVCVSLRSEWSQLWSHWKIKWVCIQMMQHDVLH